MQCSRRPGKRPTVVALIVTLALGILLAPLAAGAQPAGKVARIGYLSLRSSGPNEYVDAFLQGLREHGYVVGQNIVIEYRWAAGRPDRLRDLAAELVRLKVDIIVASATPVIQAAKDATRTIPIVMAAAPDPIATGLVASLARPGGNITGLSILSTELAGKWLQLIKELVPGATRVAVLAQGPSLGTQLLFRELQAAARVVGVQLQLLEVRGPDDFDSAFAAMKREGAGALIVQASPLSVAHPKVIAELAAKHRLAAMYGVRVFVDEGGLVSYGPSLLDMFRRAAVYVDKILKGAKPADLPVEQPTKFEMVVNLKTARALGLTIPQSVLIRADHVIQ
ncbi:MAG: ABC transporter substrate-binding protein [Candidatus Rokubacteria bacterium]|nr:ABC transporter substrate-binding protein [Candidatus Rokubacteria bacterium]